MSKTTRRDFLKLTGITALFGIFGVPDALLEKSDHQNKIIADEQDKLSHKIQYTYTCTDVDGIPIRGALVYITTDRLGEETIWAGITGNDGIAQNAAGKPWLDQGRNYYIWCWSSKTVFVNPQVEVI